ncbi:hypothetical protein BZY71_23885 [Leclercia adecarboxylata]|uniref:hypothetical protein n=1 Tax=Leclercia adecarboxylata TaxID=83655 RepID=UPI00098096CB|nr:hypothetical protein [Leclercia adecarboxylata]OOB84607.1 hypothetical protein BZY71_23885 [Leclercia adecarboxylata]
MTAQATTSTENTVVTPELSLRTWLERTGNGKRKGNGMVINPTAVVEVAGFNTRTAGMGEAYYDMPEVKAHIERICNAYLADAMAVTPIVVQILNNIAVLRQGACRTRALVKANRIREAEGLEPITEVRVEEFRGNSSEAELFTLTGNDNLPLSIVAESVSIQRLHTDADNPRTVAELAVLRNKSEQHIRKMLKIPLLPEAIQQMLVRDEVSAYVALDEYAASGEKAVEYLRAAFEKYGKATEGTVKHIKAVEMATSGAGRSVNIQTPPADGKDGVDDTDNTPAGIPNQSGAADGQNSVDGAADDLNGEGTPPPSADGKKETSPAPDNAGGKKKQGAAQPSLSQTLNRKTVTSLADTAIPVFRHILDKSKENRGKSYSEDTHTFTLTQDQMTTIAEAMSDLENYLKKHAAKQQGGEAV